MSFDSTIVAQCVRTRTALSRLLPNGTFVIPPYTEEDTVTLFGVGSIRILSVMPALSRGASLMAGALFVSVLSLMTLEFVEWRYTELRYSASLAPEHVSISQVSVQSSIANEAPVLLSLREKRIAARKEAAKNRTPLHAAAPMRLAPTVLNQRGVYLTASSIARTKFFDDTIEDLKLAHGSAVVFDVKGGGVLYHSSAPDALEIGLVRSIYDLPAAIEKLHAQGIGVIGRFVAVKDEAYTRKKPDTRMKDPVTGRVLSEWIDPANDEAIRYNMQVICELAAAGIDEINLDYIRNSGADGTLYGLSKEDKSDRLEKFIRAARETIDRCGPKTRLGLSTYAILGWNYDANVATIGQDVRRFAPLVDVISPMAYPATFAVGHYYDPSRHPRSRMYYLVYRTLTGYKELLGPEHSWKIRPWIQGYGVITKNMTDQMDAVFDAGSCGFLVWNANNNYAPTYAAMTLDTDLPVACQG